MKKLFLTMTLLGFAFLASCKGDPNTIETTEAQKTAAVSETAIQYVIDTDKSTTNWRGFKFFQDSDKAEVGHLGEIQIKSGVLSLDKGQLVAGHLVADQTSLKNIDLKEDPASQSKIENHLKSADFLNVEQYPEAHFEITEVKSLIKGDYNTQISGNLDFRGISKNITFNANVYENAGELTLKSEEFKINRKDFGIIFQPGSDAIIKDEVILQLDVTAQQKEA